MKNVLVNKNVIKAISIGLSAAMAAGPVVTALADTTDVADNSLVGEKNVVGQEGSTDFEADVQDKEFVSALVEKNVADNKAIVDASVEELEKLVDETAEELEKLQAKAKDLYDSAEEAELAKEEAQRVLKVAEDNLATAVGEKEKARKAVNEAAGALAEAKANLEALKKEVADAREKNQQNIEDKKALLEDAEKKYEDALETYKEAAKDVNEKEEAASEAAKKVLELKELAEETQKEASDLQEKAKAAQQEAEEKEAAWEAAKEALEEAKKNLEEAEKAFAEKYGDCAELVKEIVEARTNINKAKEEGTISNAEYEVLARLLIRYGLIQKGEIGVDSELEISEFKYLKGYFNNRYCVVTYTDKDGAAKTGFYDYLYKNASNVTVVDTAQEESLAIFAMTLVYKNGDNALKTADGVSFTLNDSEIPENVTVKAGESEQDNVVVNTKDEYKLDFASKGDEWTDETDFYNTYMQAKKDVDALLALVESAKADYEAAVADREEKEAAYQSAKDAYIEKYGEEMFKRISKIQELQASVDAWNHCEYFTEKSQVPGSAVHKYEALVRKLIEFKLVKDGCTNISSPDLWSDRGQSNWNLDRYIPFSYTDAEGVSHKTYFTFQVCDAEGNFPDMIKNIDHLEIYEKQVCYRNGENVLVKDGDSFLFNGEALEDNQSVDKMADEDAYVLSTISTFTYGFNSKGDAWLENDLFDNCMDDKSALEDFEKAKDEAKEAYDAAVEEAKGQKAQEAAKAYIKETLEKQGYTNVRVGDFNENQICEVKTGAMDDNGYSTADKKNGKLTGNDLGNLFYFTYTVDNKGKVSVKTLEYAAEVKDANGKTYTVRQETFGTNVFVVKIGKNEYVAERKGDSFEVHEYKYNKFLGSTTSCAKLVVGRKLGSLFSERTYFELRDSALDIQAFWAESARITKDGLRVHGDDDYFGKGRADVENLNRISSENPVYSFTVENEKLVAAKDTSFNGTTKVSFAEVDEKKAAYEEATDAYETAKEAFESAYSAEDLAVIEEIEKLYAKAAEAFGENGKITLDSYKAYDEMLVKMVSYQLEKSGCTSINHGNWHYDTNGNTENYVEFSYVDAQGISHKEYFDYILADEAGNKVNNGFSVDHMVVLKKTIVYKNGADVLSLAEDGSYLLNGEALPKNMSVVDESNQDYRKVQTSETYSFGFLAENLDWYTDSAFLATGEYVEKKAVDELEKVYLEALAVEEAAKEAYELAEKNYSEAKQALVEKYGETGVESITGIQNLEEKVASLMEEKSAPGNAYRTLDVLATERIKFMLAQQGCELISAGKWVSNSGKLEYANNIKVIYRDADGQEHTTYYDYELRDKDENVTRKAADFDHITILVKTPIFTCNGEALDTLASNQKAEEAVDKDGTVIGYVVTTTDEYALSKTDYIKALIRERDFAKEIMDDYNTIEDAKEAVIEAEKALEEAEEEKDQASENAKDAEDKVKEAEEKAKEATEDYEEAQKEAEESKKAVEEAKEAEEKAKEALEEAEALKESLEKDIEELLKEQEALEGQDSSIDALDDKYKELSDILDEMNEALEQIDDFIKELEELVQDAQEEADKEYRFLSETEDDSEGEDEGNQDEGNQDEGNQDDGNQDDGNQGDGNQDDADQGDADQGDADQGDADQGDADQGDVDQGDADQDDVNQDNGNQDDAGQGDADQGNEGQDNAGQDNAGQDNAGQNNVNPDNAGQNVNIEDEEVPQGAGDENQNVNDNAGETDNTNAGDNGNDDTSKESANIEDEETPLAANPEAKPNTAPIVGGFLGLLAAILGGTAYAEKKRRERKVKADSDLQDE